MRLLILSHILLLTRFVALGQPHNLSGKVLDAKEQTPIEFAVVQVSETGQYAITNNEGSFVIHKVQPGNIELKTSILGYVTKTVELHIASTIDTLKIELDKNTLSLDEVTVTAQFQNEPSTSFIISSTALEHEQIWDVAQIQSLLPGGKTSNSTGLTSAQRLYIRSESVSEGGNPNFGTAVEVDGIRINNNADFDNYNPYGVDTRNISTVNIQSVEVITGIPSVEHGDLSNGMVKIHTKKGRTPFNASITINPKTKQIGLDKGFRLGEKGGTLNLSAEHAKSISNVMSPYTAYNRNALNLTHEKHFENDLTLTSNVAFNVGGYNSESDPDLFTGTYTKTNDNAIRAKIMGNWFLNKSWISNLQLSTSVNYSDRLSEVRKRESAAATLSANHVTENGYFIATDYDENPDAPIVLLPTGYWYETKYTDSRLLDLTTKLKADWVKSFKKYTNKVLAGADYTNSGNLGQGTYYHDMRYTPDWRPYILSDVPHINNMAFYLEDKLTRELNLKAKLSVVAGLRSDNVYIQQSEYGWVGNISPRMNAKFEQNNGKSATLRNYNVYAGWGKSVKLPSLGVLNPSPAYTDRDVFETTSTNNVAYAAYYTQVSRTLYNPDLKYQSNNQIEIGFGGDIKGTKINVSAYRNKTLNPYIYETVFTPYSYKKTKSSAYEDTEIAVENRRFTINQNTGIVTIHDVSGTYSSYELEYKVKKELQGRQRYTNGSPVTRMGVDWVVDFAKVKALSTSFRLDGNFYYYKGIEEHMLASKYNGNMANGEPYPYVGYYVGSTSYANGRTSKQVNANFTVKTHIPKIRMVLTMRIESSLYNYSQYLSEYSGGTRGFTLENRSDYEGDDTDIYNRNEFVGIYPLYYTSWDDMETQIPFKEKYLWAKENDPELYTELSRLVLKTYYKNYFSANKLSAYYSANINVTKEIGDLASVSFFARNFTQNLGHVSSTKSESETSLYNSYIPDFYYGITMRIKI